MTISTVVRVQRAFACSADTIYDAWLDPDTDREQLSDLMIPYVGDDLETYPVSRFVNSPRTNDERCIEPAA